MFWQHQPVVTYDFLVLQYQRRYAMNVHALIVQSTSRKMIAKYLFLILRCLLISALSYICTLVPRPEMLWVLWSKFMTFASSDSCCFCANVLCIAVCNCSSFANIDYRQHKHRTLCLTAFATSSFRICYMVWVCLPKLILVSNCSPTAAAFKRYVLIFTNVTSPMGLCV